jgi:peptide/nickel transport system substrate-binding protein
MGGRESRAESHGHTRRDALRAATAGGVLLGSSGLLAACGGGSSPANTHTSTSVTPSGGTPKHGGSLRVGATGGSSLDTLDGQFASGRVDFIRCQSLYDSLVVYKDHLPGLNYRLAEEMIPSKDATSWTVRLRPDVTFHNGKSLSPEDVIFSLRRIGNPKKPGTGGHSLALVDLNGLKAIDDRTVHIPMKAPYATFTTLFSGPCNGAIVPVGFDPKHPVGTGPFKFQSFTPGRQSVFTANRDYWEKPYPYLDELTIIDFPDETSAYDAVQSGTIDAFGGAPVSLAPEAKGVSGLKLNVSGPGVTVILLMDCQKPPFNDVRVREAFKLIVNRPQMIEHVVQGYAIPGNDVSIGDVYYNSVGLPQRVQDLEQAKSLLKSAGQAGLSVKLLAANTYPGEIPAAEVFAQQALGAGVKVQVETTSVTDFYGPNWLTYQFSADNWSPIPYLLWATYAMLPTSQFNETHFNSPRYTSMYNEANSTVNDDAKLQQLIHSMMEIEHNEGGDIIPYWENVIDIVSTKVNGIPPGNTGYPLGNSDFKKIWLGD